MTTIILSVIFIISVIAIFYYVTISTMLGPIPKRGRFCVSTYETIAASVGAMMASGGGMAASILQLDAQLQWALSAATLVGALIVMRFLFVKMTERRYSAASISCDENGELVHISPANLFCSGNSSDLYLVHYENLKNDKIHSTAHLRLVTKKDDSKTVTFAVDRPKEMAPEAIRERAVKMKLSYSSLYAVV